MKIPQMQPSIILIPQKEQLCNYNQAEKKKRIKKKKQVIVSISTNNLLLARRSVPLPSEGVFWLQDVSEPGLKGKPKR